jgi:hypothetical protein
MLLVVINYEYACHLRGLALGHALLSGAGRTADSAVTDQAWQVVPRRQVFTTSNDTKEPRTKNVTAAKQSA